MTEMVPVGAIPVSWAFRSGDSFRAAKMLCAKSGKPPRSAASSTDARRASRCIEAQLEVVVHIERPPGAAQLGSPPSVDDVRPGDIGLADGHEHTLHSVLDVLDPRRSADESCAELGQDLSGDLLGQPPVRSPRLSGSPKDRVGDAVGVERCHPPVALAHLVRRSEGHASHTRAATPITMPATWIMVRIAPLRGQMRCRGPKDVGAGAPTSAQAAPASPQ